MASKQIALSLKIDGVEYSVEQLQKLSDKAKEVEQSTSNISGKGAQGLDQVGNAAEKAAQKTETLKNSSESVGLTIDKQLQNFTKFATGVTGAFSAAATAATLFGADSSKATKFAENAQKAFNVVLGASAAIESVLALKKLLTVSATQKQAVASGQAAAAEGVQTTATLALAGAETVATTTTLTLTGAINTLGAAIKANPIGLILTLVSAAAVAMTAFSDETDDGADAVARLDNETRKLIQTEDELLASIQRTTQLELAKAQARGASLEELRDIRQKEINTEINVAKEKLRILRNAQDAENKIIDESELKNEEKVKKKLEIEQKYGTQIFQQQQAQFAAQNKLAIDQVNTEKEIRERNFRISIENAKLRTSLLKEGLQKELDFLEIEKREKIKAARDNGTSLKLIDDAFNKEREDIIKSYQERLNKIVEDNATERYRLEQEPANKLLTDLRKNQQKQLDDFVKISDEINKQAGKSLEKTENAYVQVGNMRVAYGQKFTKDQIEEAQKIIDTFVKQENELAKKVFSDAAKAKLEIQDKNLKALINQQENYFNEEEQMFLSQNEVITSALIDYQQQQLIVYNTDFQAYKDAQLKKLEIDLTIENERKGNYKKSEADLKASIDEQKKIYGDLLEQIRVAGEEEIKLNNAKLAQQTELNILIKNSNLERIKLDEMYYKGVIDLQNKYALNDKMSRKEIENNDIELKRKLRDQELAWQKDQLDIQRKLVEEKLKILEKDPTMNVEALKALKAELAKIETDYNNLVRQGVQNTATDNETKFNETINRISKYVAAFEDIINKVASASAARFSFFLLALEAQYQETLGRIADEEVRQAGESDEQFAERQKQILAKRKETEEIYLANKKQLEKEAQIASLKIQLVQATASAAQAVLSVLGAPPPIGGNPILQGILIAANAAIAASQIATISQTINTVQSMARGGFLRGPSHEQGGIKYQGGGIELEGSEAIINRRSTLQYAGLLSQINEQGGGKPIYVNSIMDSRMAEVLASTKNEPIRAYVLEQDITKSQAVNRRLEELASF